MSQNALLSASYQINEQVQNIVCSSHDVANSLNAVGYINVKILHMLHWHPTSSQ